MGASSFAGLAIPKPEPRKRVKARLDRVQAKADKAVYAAVDQRDQLRCRLCGEYQGYEIQRHHILSRALGGETSTANVLSLCANCHLVGVHGKHLRVSGNADTRNSQGALSGVHLERLVDGEWRSEGYR